MKYWERVKETNKFGKKLMAPGSEPGPARLERKILTTRPYRFVDEIDDEFGIWITSRNGSTYVRIVVSLRTFLFVTLTF